MSASTSKAMATHMQKWVGLTLPDLAHIFQNATPVEAAGVRFFLHERLVAERTVGLHHGLLEREMQRMQHVVVIEHADQALHREVVRSMIHHVFQHDGIDGPVM